MVAANDEKGGPRPKDTAALPRGLEDAIAGIVRLRGSKAHEIAEPASDEAIVAARAAFGDLFTDELAALYRAANGFRINAQEHGECDLRCFSLEELHTPRSWVDEWDYRLNGDPNRLLVFASPNGSYISFTRLGLKAGVWLDDFREGVQGVAASTLTKLLQKIVAALNTGDRRVFIGNEKAVPSAYLKELARLDEAARAEAHSKWEAESAAGRGADDDWSDL